MQEVEIAGFKLPWVWIVVLLAVFAIIAGIIFWVFPQIAEQSTIKIKVESLETGLGIPETNAKLYYAGQLRIARTDSQGFLEEFQVSLGSLVRVEIEREGFERFKEEFTASTRVFNFTARLEEKPLEEFLITLAKNSGKSLKGTLARVELSCTGSGVLEKTSFDVNEGYFTVKKPLNCVNLIAKVSADGFNVSGGNVISQASTIMLSEIETPKGETRILAVDESGKRIKEKELTISIFDSLGKLENLRQVSIGEAVFSNLKVGDYNAVVNDESGEWVQARSARFEVKENQTIQVKVELSKQPKAIVNFKVVEEQSSRALENVKVFLLKENKVAASFISKTEETKIALLETGSYSVKASLEEFLNFEAVIEVVEGTQSFEIGLENCSEELKNCGIIEVKVVDENDKRIESAEVLLFKEDGFLARLNAELTDANGIAEFSSIPEGKYYLLARKASLESKGSVFDLKTEVPVFQTVKLVVGKGIARVIVKDIKGIPVQEASVQFQTAMQDCSGEECTVLTNERGIAQKEFRADKIVFFKVSKAGFQTFHSQETSIMPKVPKVFEVILEQEAAERELKIELLNVLDSEGKQTSELKAGKTFKAVLKLSVPESLSENKAGVHLRVGKKNFIGEDFVFFKGINAANALIVKGTSFAPPTNEELDFGNLTSGNAKWVNIEWNAVESGVFIIEAEFAVKSETPANTELPFYYRAWVVESEKWVRVPFDEVLESKKETLEKQGLYAKAFEKSFSQGNVLRADKPFTVCGAEFCLVEERIMNEETKQLQQEHELTFGIDYTISFKLVNDGEQVFDNLKLKVFNSENGFDADDALLFKFFEIKNADNARFSSPLNDFEVPEVEVGVFEPKEEIEVSLKVNQSSVYSSMLAIKLFSATDEVFFKQIAFTATAENNLHITTSVKEIPLFVKESLEVRVTDRQGSNVHKALVKVSKVDGQGRQELLNLKMTDEFGIAVFSIPKMTAKSKLVIEAEKPNYYPARQELPVKGLMLRFEPEKIESVLNQASFREEALELKAVNESGLSFFISFIEAKGNFTAVLNLEKLNFPLYKHIGQTVFYPGEEEIIQLKIALDEDVVLKTPRTMQGSLLLEVADLELDSFYQFNIPMQVLVELQGSLDRQDCLEISLNDWNGTTIEGIVKTSLKLKNKCTVQGIPVKVEELSARILWKNEILGNVDLTVKETSTGLENSEVLSEKSVKLFNSIEPGKNYDVNLAFLPFTGNLGKKALFDVYFEGKVWTQSGKKQVKASDKIKGKIFIANLEQCLNFKPKMSNGIEISKKEEFESFEVSTVECGPIPISIRFCNNDAGCAGGTEGGIALDKTKISSLEEDSEFVSVSRVENQIAGSYGIKVEVKSPNTEWKKIGEFPVFVEPDEENYYFFLDKYNFVTIGEGSKDSAQLTNTKVTEKVIVTACAEAWGEAGASPDFMGLGVSLATTMGFSFLAGASALGASALIEASFEAASLFYGAADFLASGAAYSGVMLGVAIGQVTGQLIGGVAGKIVGTVISLFLTYLLCFDPISCIIGILASLSQLIGGWGDDCNPVTMDFADYIINLSGKVNPEMPEHYLPPDAQNIIMSHPAFTGQWQLQITDGYSDPLTNDARQHVGVIIENTQGLESPEYSYSILEASATEHVHGGNFEHVEGMSEVDCGSDGDFGMLYVKCDEETITRREKFHVRIKTMEVPQKIPEISDFETTYPCYSGSLIGRTGKGALPRVRFNWSWLEEGGIGINDCDAKNPNAVYCDATQFTIVVAKKIQALEKLLELNNYLKGVCPNNEWDALRGASYGVFDGNIALKYKVQVDGNVAVVQAFKEQEMSSKDSTITAVVKNSSDKNAAVSLKMTVKDSLGNEFGNCTVQSVNLLAFEEVEKQCSFTLEPKLYFTFFELSPLPENQASISSKNYSLGFLVTRLSPLITSGFSDCEIPFTTEVHAGFSTINRFFDEFGEENIVWTPEVPNLNALTNLMHFEALLIEDNYNEDFLKDFSKYYSEDSFSDAPVFFTEQFKKYFDNNLMKFSQRYWDDSKLYQSGKFKVDVELTFAKDWKLFDNEGNPKAVILVSFYPLEEPKADSPFYHLPFDGRVGLNESLEFDRNGYGVAFENVNPEDLMKLDEVIFTMSYDSNKSSGQDKIVVDKSRDFETLNSRLETRGNILSIYTEGNKKKIDFTPSFATPVLMKVNAEESSEPFNAFYSFTQNNVPVIPGESLAGWTGASSECLDFSGKNLLTEFQNKLDRKGKQEDSFFTSKWNKAFALDWPNVEYNGSVWLKTLFFTPTDKDNSLQAIHPVNQIGFETPDYKGTSVQLNGISRMQHNRQGLTESDSINSLQDVFEMVEEQAICVTNTGTKTRYWWNPKAVFTQEGRISSIVKEISNIESERKCIR